MKVSVTGTAEATSGNSLIEIKRTRRRALPGMRYRTKAKAAGAPRMRDKQTVARAILRLIIPAPMNSLVPAMYLYISKVGWKGQIGMGSPGGTMMLALSEIEYLNIIKIGIMTMRNIIIIPINHTPV